MYMLIVEGSCWKHCADSECVVLQHHGGGEDRSLHEPHSVHRWLAGVHLQPELLQRAGQQVLGLRLRPEQGSWTGWVHDLRAFKGVVHPQNDFLSIDYSCLGDLSSIVFFWICRIRKTKKRIRVNLPLFILIGDPRPRGSPIKMNGGKFTKTIFLS